ncbi:hypothetical protein FKP32DRAFT_1674255 [Trametes sanguinea]|nr:hypothetical protein FKP32DRAFT_1674255 [Trametes sanguinea]
MININKHNWLTEWGKHLESKNPSANKKKAVRRASKRVRSSSSKGTGAGGKPLAPGIRGHAPKLLQRTLHSWLSKGKGKARAGGRRRGPVAAVTSADGTAAVPRQLKQATLRDTWFPAPTNTGGGAAPTGSAAPNAAGHGTAGGHADARGPQADAAGPTPNPSPQGSGTSSSTGSSPGWQLRAPEGQTITKGNAKAKYRVKDGDLAALPMVVKAYRAAEGNTYEMHLYQERDVELKALERHGGPVGFTTYLMKLYKTYKNSPKRQNNPFEEPDYYRVSAPAPAPAPAGPSAL